MKKMPESAGILGKNLNLVAENSTGGVDFDLAEFDPKDLEQLRSGVKSLAALVEVVLNEKEAKKFKKGALKSIDIFEKTVATLSVIAEE